MIDIGELLKEHSHCANKVTLHGVAFLFDGSRVHLKASPGEAVRRRRDGIGGIAGAEAGADAIG